MERLRGNNEFCDNSSNPSKSSNDLQIDESKMLVTSDDSTKDQISRYGIIMYSEYFKRFYKEIQRDVNNFIVSKNEQMVIFICGADGSGKTNLALNIATETRFPHVKYVSGYTMIGMTESQKTQYIKECFDDANKSSQSVIVLDDMENIIEWFHANNLNMTRFSTNICTTLNSLIKHVNLNKKLIICTFNSESFHSMRYIGLMQIPNKTYDIPKDQVEDYVQEIICEIDKVPYVKKTIKSWSIKKYIFEYNNTNP